MPILIDGNNLLHSLAGPDRNREGVRRFVLDQTRFERITVTVVFDGPPPEGAQTRENLGSVSIVYSGAASADDVIIRRIPQRPQAKSWTIVTNDRGLSRRAADRGASVRSLSSWMNRRKRPPVKNRRSAEAPLSKAEVDAWERYFEGDE